LSALAVLLTLLLLIFLPSNNVLIMKIFMVTQKFVWFCYLLVFISTLLFCKTARFTCLTCSIPFWCKVASLTNENQLQYVVVTDKQNKTKPKNNEDDVKRFKYQ